MPAIEDYGGQKPAWCPGCGNFVILKTLKEALVELGISPQDVLVVSGIGQGAKTPHYMQCHTFNGLHGRTLPVATSARLVNHEMTIIAVAGDGDCYGEGGNHLMHAIRRNVNVALFVCDNQVYGLTKGQASPTTREGTVTKTQPFGTPSEQLNPMALAVALDASFAARGSCGDPKFLRNLMTATITHRGFALLDILQPCVTFNRVNTYEWYKKRVYRIGDDHDPEDRLQAFRLSLEWGEKIPTGVIYRKVRPTMEDLIPVIKDAPLIRQEFDLKKGREIIESINP